MFGLPSGPSGQVKLKQVTQILSALRSNQNDHALSDEDRRSQLEQLKILGRDPKDADPIFTPETVKLLASYGFGDQALPTAREAMRCLANTLLLKRDLIQTFVGEGYGPKAAEHLKLKEDDDEFLICRILLLTTYGSNLDFATLVEKYALAESMRFHLNRHSHNLTSGNQIPPMESMALAENLKLIYNITNRDAGLTQSLNPCVAPLANILSYIPLPRPPLQPPITFLINALAQLDFQDEKDIFPSTDPHSRVDKLITILDKAMVIQLPDDIETVAVPLVILLHKIYDIAPPPSKSHIQSSLLPSQSDRDLPIGQSTSLSSRLIRTTTNPLVPKLGEALAGFYFELSSQSPTTFVKNVGYGYAAGYLMSRNIAVPPDMNTNSHNTDENIPPVNPITGQRLDREPEVDTGPEMTEEEKEREAERLFVLFERLRATGVVDVANPVAQAMQQGYGNGGRVEEVEDSDSD